MALYLGREKIKITASGTIKPTLQEKTVTPTTSLQNITPDNGYYGLSKVTVEGDDNLVADNIKSGVSIFGVDGTYEGSGGGGVETCTVTAEGHLSASIYCVDPITGTLINGEPFTDYIEEYKTYTVLKNSIIYVITSEWGYEWIVTNGEILTDVSNDFTIFVHITGDCIITP